MLYQLFKYLFYPTIRAYFSSVRVINTQNIPSEGPVILAVNHTSAFMDPILVATFTKRIYHFLARGEAFNSKAAVFFYKKLNMLPIFRPETMPGEVHKNKFVFQQCYDHLSKNKAIMVFPEGFSKTERRIREVKSGLARIALGAESQNNFSLNVKIIPIGINYSDPHRFRSDVLINVGEPILTADFKDLFESNEKAAYEMLTETIRKQLEKSTVFISDERQESFIESIEWFYHNLSTDNKSEELNLSQKFNLSKEIVKGVESLADNSPKEFTSLESKLINYKNRMARLRLDQGRLKKPHFISTLMFNALLLVVGLPLFTLGLLSNIFPLSITGVIAKKIKVREDFTGSLKLTAGMFVFLIVYLIQCYVISFFLSFTLSFASLVCFYLLGLFSLHYSKVFVKLTEGFRHFYLSKRKGVFFSKLSAEQIMLHELLEKKILQFGFESIKKGLLN